MSILLGFLEYIMDNKESLNDNIVFVFQPAEEDTGGAERLMKAGVFKKYNVDEVYGLHIHPDFEEGYVALPLTAAVSTLCHTILVMGSIYVLLAQQYAQAKNVAITAVFGLVMGTVTASGIPEAIIAAILVTVIGKALLHLSERMKKR